MGDIEDGGINRLGELFNEYHREHARVTRPDEQVVDVTLTVRIRLYGSDAHKQRAWNEAWRNAHPDWSAVQWATVSSRTPEIWGDLRATADGRIAVNHLALGHELAHVLRLHDTRLLNPDETARL